MKTNRHGTGTAARDKGKAKVLRGTWPVSNAIDSMTWVPSWREPGKMVDVRSGIIVDFGPFESIKFLEPSFFQVEPPY